MKPKHAAEAHGPGHALERLIFFSDAVFAIAITLLVIEIHVPHVTTMTDQAFLQALADLVPNFTGFFISFFVIGAFWAGHHRAFDCARHWSPRLVLPNLMLLSSVAALPFFTAFSSEYHGQRVPVAFYCGWLVLMALLNLLIQRIATTPPVAGDHVTPAHRRMLAQRGFGTLLGAMTGLVVSLFNPPIGQVALISIPLWRLLMTRVLPAR